MAHSLSAKKRIRQSENNNARNKARRESLKNTIRTFKSVLASGDQTKIQEELCKATKAVDKAGTKGILHRNTVSRRKASLARAVNRSLSTAK